MFGIDKNDSWNFFILYFGLNYFFKEMCSKHIHMERIAMQNLLCGKLINNFYIYMQDMNGLGKQNWKFYKSYAHLNLGYLP